MLEILGKRHEEWVRMAISAGSPPLFAQDIIQEVYLRLHKYRETAKHKLIDKKGGVNLFYMWGVVRNTTRTELSKENKYLLQSFIMKKPMMKLTLNLNCDTSN